MQLMRSKRPRFRLKQHLRVIRVGTSNEAVDISSAAVKPYELPGHPAECDCPLCERELLLRVAKAREDASKKPQAG
jgi:hypothetical protein